MPGKFFLYGFWILATGILAILAMGYKDNASSIVAEVEPQRYAISFEKPIKIKEIYVIPGQHVKKGEKLLKVERPDLLLDSERKLNALQALQAQDEIKKIEKSNQLILAKINYEQECARIKTDIEQLKLILKGNLHMSRNLEALNLLPDSVKEVDQSYIQLKLDQLEKELVSEKKQYEINVDEINKVYMLEAQSRQLEVQQLNQEIRLLEKEESELIQYANVDGTIGNIYSEDEELVPPYNTLISIYESNPTIIRALVNEQMQIDLNSGDEVFVESTNRKYKIKGTVLEIGSRIIEYPNRLNPLSERPVWGRELFIKIPDESNFLNGEKVFVILD